MKSVKLNISGRQIRLPLPVAVMVAIGAVVILLFTSTSGETGKSSPKATTTSASQGTAATVTTAAATKQEKTTTAAALSQEYKFRNKKLLDQHYEKHGKDMGFDSAEDYEKAACAVVNDQRALHKIESEDGDDVYYIEQTNEFVIVSADGWLRTYFLPDRGKAYFDKQ